jgi:hypothetical protein
MAWLSEKLGEFGRRIFMFLRRDRFDAELEQEMRLHLELREQEKIEEGLSLSGTVSKLGAAPY